MKRKYSKKIISALFYKYINRKLSSPSGVAPLSDLSGKRVTSDADKANLLNDFFGSVFSIDNGQLPPFPNRLPDANHCHRRRHYKSRPCFQGSHKTQT